MAPEPQVESTAHRGRFTWQPENQPLEGRCPRSNPTWFSGSVSFRASISRLQLALAAPNSFEFGEKSLHGLTSQAHRLMKCRVKTLVTTKVFRPSGCPGWTTQPTTLRCPIRTPKQDDPGWKTRLAVGHAVGLLPGPIDSALGTSPEF